MARFRLTAPHMMDVRLGDGWTSVQLEAGTEIDSADQRPHWQPTPAMVALDAEAQQWLERACIDWRVNAIDGSVIGHGSTQTLPDVTGPDIPAEGR